MRALVCHGPGKYALQHKPRQLITHHFRLGDMLKAYDTFENAMRERALKIIIEND